MPEVEPNRHVGVDRLLRVSGSRGLQHGKLTVPGHSDGRGLFGMSLDYAAVSKSCLSNPSRTIRICFGGYSRARANASSGVPRSQVSNSSSWVNRTGMRSWLMVETSEQESSPVKLKLVSDVG